MIIGMGQKINPAYAALQDKVVIDGVPRPSYERRLRENALINNRQSVVGDWNSRDWFYCWYNDSGLEDYGLYNWRNPYALKLVKTGTVTYTSLDGHMGNGTNGRYSTGWSPSTGPNMLQDSAAVEFYMTTDGGAVSFGCNTSGDRYINLNSWVIRLNEAAASAGDSPLNPGVGHWVFTKNALNNAIKFWKNGVDDTPPAITSTGAVPADVPFYIFCRNSAGTASNFSATEFSYMSAGAHISDAPGVFSAWSTFTS